MRKSLMFFAALAVAIGTIGIGGAAADSTGPIDFESYSLGTIDGQQGWTKTGAYDVEVASATNVPAVGTLGFGSQALRFSDAVTTGSFGDQTFSPSLTQAAGESGQTHFEASFKIGTTSASEQTGLHMSVSPDNGSGGRMSYLRFADQADGVHVFFDDATDTGPYYKQATFSDVPVATLAHSTAHTIGFSIDFKPGPANDVVKISVDGVLATTGTTWEDYYRYDNEQQGAGAVPTTNHLLFREAGDANPANGGHGFLVDGVSLASSMTPPPCTPTGLHRDGLNLTAAQINPATVTGTVNATGCNIGVYYGPGSTGTVTGANISGANYYGVVADGAQVNISGARSMTSAKHSRTGRSMGSACSTRRSIRTTRRPSRPPRER